MPSTAAPKHARTCTETPKPTLTGAIRERAKQTLRRNVETFMGNATPEDIRFLSAVLANHEMIGYQENEMVIADAFEQEIGCRNSQTAPMPFSD